MVNYGMKSEKFLILSLFRNNPLKMGMNYLINVPVVVTMTIRSRRIFLRSALRNFVDFWTYSSTVRGEMPMISAISLRFRP